MEKEELVVTVSGKTGTGKSRLIYLLKNFLREQNFNVEYELNDDYSTEAKFDERVGRGFGDAIEAIKNRSDVRIREFRVNKPNEIRGKNLKVELKILDDNDKVVSSTKLSPNKVKHITDSEQWDQVVSDMSY